jgi:hypothetical protein
MMMNKFPSLWIQHNAKDGGSVTPAISTINTQQGYGTETRAFYG